jgi:hypothetical protein
LEQVVLVLQQQAQVLLVTMALILCLAQLLARAAVKALLSKRLVVMAVRVVVVEEVMALHFRVAQETRHLHPHLKEITAVAHRGRNTLVAAVVEQGLLVA